MNDPYAVLGVKPDDDDATIRKAYLELVRLFPPDQHPDKFAQVRTAYDRLKSIQDRVQARLFGIGKVETVEEVVDELVQQQPRKRLSLNEVNAMIRESAT